MRDENIDVLRFIGLAMIILAHVDPPPLLFQLRNFDVPLMVLVSGMSFGLSYRGNEAYLGYFWKRIKRLVFPVWIFLTFIFVAIYVHDPGSSDLQPQTIIASYDLSAGIGFVWIIRVFLLVALTAPFIYRFHKQCLSDQRYLSYLLLTSILYEVIRYFAMPFIQTGAGYVLSMSIQYAVAYSIIFALGLRTPKLKRTILLKIIILSTVVFLCYAGMLHYTKHHFIQTQDYKYPPSFYYFSYAIAISALLWLYSPQLVRMLGKVTFAKKIVLFISQNSIWVYLWHIPFIKFLYINHTAKYIVAFSAASTLAFIQVWLVKNVALKWFKNKTIAKNIKLVFTG